MRISVRGTDRGGALLSALVLILVLSAFCAVLAQRVTAASRLAETAKSRVIESIGITNREIRSLHDLH